MKRKTILKIALSILFVIVIVILLAFLLYVLFFPHPIDHCCPYNPENSPGIITNTSQYYDPVDKDWVLYDPIWGDWIRTDDENQYCFFSSLGNFERGFLNPHHITQTGQWTKMSNTTYLIHFDNLTNETIIYNASTDHWNASNGTYRLIRQRRDDEKRYGPS
jgi:hypothetical protein